MLEIWNGVKAAKEMEVDWIVDIDFSRQEIGDQFITNFGSLDLGLVKGSKLDGLTAPHGVEDVPGFGRAFLFNGNVWFLNPNNIIPNYVEREIILEIDYKANQDKLNTVPMSTGGYDRHYLPFITGFFIRTNYGGYNFLHYHSKVSQDTKSGLYLPILENEDIHNVKINVVNSRLNFTDNNQTTSRVFSALPKEYENSHFCIGNHGSIPGSHNYGFKGWIKSLKIGFLN